MSTYVAYIEVQSDPTLWERIRSRRSRKKGKSPAAAYGVLVAAGVVLAYLLSLAGWLPADPDAMDLGAMNQLPSARHLLGTDFVGRDLLARAMVGTQAFFLPGLLSVFVSLLFGTPLRRSRRLLPERFATPVGLFLQLLESLPKLVLVLLVIALFRPDIYLILLVVTEGVSPTSPRPPSFSGPRSRP